MAGLVPLSLQTVFDNTGRPAIGARLYTYAAGTTTPQTVYQDSGLTIAYPNYLEADSVGRLPQMFAADGNIKLRLTTSAGVELLAVDSILVIGPSSGGGGGGSVDATSVFDTGDLKVKYGTGALSGYVRANGRTIGSATSGASERANADTQDLFEYLWNEDDGVDLLTVSTGKGASAAADWAANKTITLPDWRGCLIGGLDDMGTTAAGRLTSTYFGTAATVLGALGGSESHTLTTAQLATHGHSITDPGHTHSIIDPGHVHGVLAKSSPSSGGTTPGLATGAPDTTVSGGATSNTTGITNGSATTGITAGNAGSGSAHNNVQPTRLATIYLRL